MTTEYITLNVWNAENVRVKANQREVNSRFLEVQFIDKNEPLDLEDKQVFFLAKRPDGDIIFDCCEIINEETGKINLALTSQMSAVAGIMKDFEFDIISQDLSKLKVKGLILEIERCTDFDSETESTSEFTALEEAMAGYERASDAIDAHMADKENPHEVTAAQIGAAENSHTHSANDITSGALPIDMGGTGVTTAAEALAALGGMASSNFISGIFVGNGQESKTITLSFTPKFFIVYLMNQSPIKYNADNGYTLCSFAIGSSYYGCTKGLSISGANITVKQSTSTPSDGVFLNLNRSLSMYIYFAIKS